jgi:hypothetical protein
MITREAILGLVAAAALTVGLTGCSGDVDGPDATEPATGVNEGAVSLGDGRIVPNHSMKGVRLGMTSKEVKARWGSRPDEIIRFGEGRYVQYRYGMTRVTFLSGRGVVTLVTESPRMRTASGLHVGSTEAVVKATLPNPHCEVDICWTVKRVHGQVARTFFALKEGEISMIYIMLTPI